MLINGESYQSIWYESDTDSVKIIDQTQLPHKFTIITLASLDDACVAISSMQVRGAPLIGVTAVFGLYLAVRNSEANGELKEDEFIHAAINRLQATRPTAVNLHWALQRAREYVADNALAANQAELLLQLALQMAVEDVASCEAMGEYGADLLERIWHKKCETENSPDTVLNVLTHCNAGALATVDWGTALAVIYKAHGRGIKLQVWVDETRPRNQGAALTCWELAQHNIDHHLIVDNVGGHLMQQGMVDVCVVGSDRTTANGDVCNKIGTYLKALAAQANKIPFYAVLPVSTIDFNLDSGSDIPIEIRDEDEVHYVVGIDAAGERSRVRVSPEQTTAVNYGFDVTPAHLVTAIITERGVYSANKKSLAELQA